MSYLDSLISQLKPTLVQIQNDPTSNASYRARWLLREKIVRENDKYGFFLSTDNGRTMPSEVFHAGRCVMAMTISVSDMEDVEKAVEFLFQGFVISAKLSYDMCGRYDADTLIAACRGIELKC